MASKRQTKKQREVEELKKLEQRLRDIYSGASGSEWASNLDDDGFTPDLRMLSYVIPAVEAVLDLSGEKHYLVAGHNLDAYESPKTLAEFLYRHGIRA